MYTFADGCKQTLSLAVWTETDQEGATRGWKIEGMGMHSGAPQCEDLPQENSPAHSL